MIDLGDTYRISVPIADPGGTPATPASATLTITLPDDTTVTVTPTIGVNVATYDYPTVQAGRHRFALATTGPVTSYRDIFDVRTSADNIVSLAAAKKQLNIRAVDTGYDDEIRGFVESVTDVIEQHVGATVLKERTDTVTLRTGVPECLLVYRPVTEIISVTDVRTGSAPYDLSDVAVDENGVLFRLSGGSLSGRLRIVYRAGYRVIPSNRTHAALIILQHLWETQRIKSDQRARLPRADEVFVQSSDGRWFSIPRKALELLDGDGIGGFA